MADKTTETTENNIQIGIEQICAAILTKLGSIEIPLEVLVADYSKKVIAVNQDEETKVLSFSLVDSEIVEDINTQAENE